MSMSMSMSMSKMFFACWLMACCRVSSHSHLLLYQSPKLHKSNRSKYFFFFSSSWPTKTKSVVGSGAALMRTNNFVKRRNVKGEVLMLGVNYVFGKFSFTHERIISICAFIRVQLLITDFVIKLIVFYFFTNVATLSNFVSIFACCLKKKYQMKEPT
jgi:hypothetical protein